MITCETTPISLVNANAKDPGLEELNLIKKVPTGWFSKSLVASSKERNPWNHFSFKIVVTLLIQCSKGPNPFKNSENLYELTNPVLLLSRIIFYF